MKEFNSDFKKVVCYNIRRYRKESGTSDGNGAFAQPQRTV